MILLIVPTLVFFKLPAALFWLGYLATYIRSASRIASFSLVLNGSISIIFIVIVFYL